MEITPGRRNLRIQKGQDFVFRFKLIIKSTGLPVDLTNATIISQIRESKNRANSTLIAEFACQVDGVDTPNPAPTNNEITLSLTDAETALIDACGGGYYDVLIIDSNGTDQFWVDGSVTFVDTVTVKP